MTHPTWAADVVAITDVLSRLAGLADVAADLDDYLALMTDDVVFVFADNPQVGFVGGTLDGRDAVGAAAVARRASGLQGPGTHTMHITSTEYVDFPDPDHAVAHSYWRFYADTDSAPRLTSMGRYETTLRRTAEGWRVARRVVTMV